MPEPLVGTKLPPMVVTNGALVNDRSVVHVESDAQVITRRATLFAGATARRMLPPKSYEVPATIPGTHWESAVISPDPDRKPVQSTDPGAGDPLAPLNADPA